jgi:hypothetical protein
MSNRLKRLKKPLFCLVEILKILLQGFDVFCQNGEETMDILTLNCLFLALLKRKMAHTT